MKNRIKWLLQTAFGFGNYLVGFSIFKIFTLRWDSHEGHFLHFLKLIPAEGLVLDIGANIGIMTVLLARNAPARTVLAFEPMPANFRALERVVRIFRLGNVRLFQWALGDSAGEVEMVMPVQQGVRLQGISHVISTAGEPESVGERVTVPCKRLDDLTELFQMKPIVGIKIDVENFEQYVFAGAQEILRRYRPVVYAELGPGENRERSLSLFLGMRYHVRVLQDGQLQALHPVRHQDYSNLFLIPD